tara:strand:- start:1343 stop:1918 length:576 start_codon:yes stop_codon:yes gene_type:complete
MEANKKLLDRMDWLSISVTLKLISLGFSRKTNFGCVPLDSNALEKGVSNVENWREVVNSLSKDGYIELIKSNTMLPRISISSASFFLQREYEVAFYHTLVKQEKNKAKASTAGFNKTNESKGKTTPVNVVVYKVVAVNLKSALYEQPDTDILNRKHKIGDVSSVSFMIAYEKAFSLVCDWIISNIHDNDRQ